MLTAVRLLGDQHWFTAERLLDVQNWFTSERVLGDQHWFTAERLLYRGRAGARVREAAAEPARLHTQAPTHVRWGELDPVMRVEWSDRLPEFFADVRLERLPRVR